MDLRGLRGTNTKGSPAWRTLTARIPQGILTGPGKSLHCDHPPPTGAPVEPGERTEDDWVNSLMDDERKLHAQREKLGGSESLLHGTLVLHELVANAPQNDESRHLTQTNARSNLFLDY